jgi:hypothetical protein
MKRTQTLITLLAALLSAMPVFAQEGHERVVGTVTRVEKSRIEVKGTDGKPIAVELKAGTVYTKGKASATIADVKPGARVTVEATKGKAGLEAMKVQIETAAVIYTCPMHPEVQQPRPGKCPKCGMNLEKKD